MKVVEFLLRIWQAIKNVYLKARRMLYWGWAMRNNYDWDHDFIIEMLVLKMERMRNYFLKHGYHSTECKNYKPKMQSISLAIKLGHRLLRNEYEMHQRAFAKKYGPLNIRTTPESSTPNSVTLIFTLNKAYVTDDQLRESAEAWQADENMKNRDYQRFYKIISKYSTYWWD
jgi:hypothetical protein